MQISQRLVAVFIVTTSGCSVEILHDLDEGQANQVLAALSREGVAARKERVGGGKPGYAVSVPRAAAPQAWRVLRQHNLPRREHKGLGEVFGKVGLIPTAAQERAMMRQAIAGELGRTLERLGGVLEARVHVVAPRRDRFNRDSARDPRASVLLRTESRCSVTEPQVKKLVAGAVDGLKQQAVNVVIDRSGKPPIAHAAVAKVGPFLVSAESRNPLIAVLVIGVVLVVGLGLAVFVLVRRQRRPSMVPLPALETTSSRDAFISQTSASLDRRSAVARPAGTRTGQRAD